MERMNTDRIPFPNLEALIRKLYDDGEYKRVIDLIDHRMVDYPEQRAYLGYWQVGMAARMQKPDLAFHFLDALLDEGLWISHTLLRQSPSLESLQGLQEYEQRIALQAELQRQEQSQLLPLVTLHQEGTCLQSAPCPLLVALHDAPAIALDAIPFWRSIALSGWLVGIPQSSQALWSRAYVWEDFDKTQREVDEHLRDLVSKYFVDSRRVVLAGNGAGGEIASLLPLSRGVDVRGFVAVNPQGALTRDPNQWMRLAQAREIDGLRGAIVAGDQDAELLPEIQRIAEILNTFDVPTRLEIVAGAGPSFEEAYEAPIQRAIDHVLS